MAGWLATNMIPGRRVIVCIESRFCYCFPCASSPDSGTDVNIVTPAIPLMTLQTQSCQADTDLMWSCHKLD